MNCMVDALARLQRQAMRVTVLAALVVLRLAWDWAT